MKAVEQLAPHVFEERMEPVYRMIKQYDQDKEEK
jgi:hypothetical protein